MDPNISGFILTIQEALHIPVLVSELFIKLNRLMWFRKQLAIYIREVFINNWRFLSTVYLKL